MNELMLRGFRIVAHTHNFSKNGGSRVGYHCPDCKHFYIVGDFSIENATHILGSSERKTCCGKVRPTPHLFCSLEEVRAFVSLLEASGTQKKATLIEKRALIIAHFDQQLVLEQARKVLR